MFLERPSRCEPHNQWSADASDGHGIELDLALRVQAAFPAFQQSTMRVEHSGGDHLLLIADELHVFRFPRVGQHDLRHEIRVLEKLARCSAVAVPCYEHVDPNGAFAGYRLIVGQPLTADPFDELAYADRRAVLAEIAAFLRTLHEIEPETIERCAAWPRSWTAAEFAARTLATRLDHVASEWPVLATSARRFFETYQAQQSPRSCVIHGDLVPEHLLIGDVSGKLSGVIDFGDVALGDPAQDLACFWNYGGPAAIAAIAFYDPNGEDPDLLVRARNHFIRYRFDRLYERLAETGQRLPVEREAALLTALLSRPSTEYRHVRR